MQREIKFRVYALIEDDDGCIGFLETRSPVASGLDFFYDGGWRGISYFLQYPETFIVHQYIGIEDKDDMEIYEDDIVRLTKPEHEVDDLVDYTTVSEEVIVVRIIQIYTGEYIGQTTPHSWYRLSDYKIKEVIGNMVENPELLK